MLSTTITRATSQPTPLRPCLAHAGTLPLCIDNAPPERNAAFVGWVGGLAAARHRGGGAPPACSAVTAAGASHLQLRHQARVTRQPTTQLAFHPSAAKLCLAAGDRGGRLALWRVGAPGQNSKKFEPDA